MQYFHWGCAVVVTGAGYLIDTSLVSCTGFVDIRSGRCKPHSWADSTRLILFVNGVGTRWGEIAAPFVGALFAAGAGAGSGGDSGRSNSSVSLARVGLVGNIGPELAD